MKRIFNKKTFEYTFPLKHPKYVIEDKALGEAIVKSMQLNFIDKLFVWKRRFYRLFHI